jgi:ABC-type lipoprotein export system ATPase subunit
VSNINDYRCHEVGLVFQLHNLLPNLNAIQNVEIAMLGTGTGHRESTDRAHALLSDVGLTARETLRPPELSGGERQRVAIARALANGPSILLADEPTGSLDSSSAASVLELFARIRNDRKLTILLVTHDAQVATAADCVVLMRDGKVVDSPNGITRISAKTSTHV